MFVIPSVFFILSVFVILSEAKDLRHPEREPSVGTMRILRLTAQDDLYRDDEDPSPDGSG